MLNAVRQKRIRGITAWRPDIWPLTKQNIACYNLNIDIEIMNTCRIWKNSLGVCFTLIC